jgi:hypothetical protein
VVLPLSVCSILSFPYGHTVAAYVFFITAHKIKMRIVSSIFMTTLGAQSLGAEDDHLVVETCRHVILANAQ